MQWAMVCDRPGHHTGQLRVPEETAVVDGLSDFERKLGRQSQIRNLLVARIRVALDRRCDILKPGPSPGGGRRDSQVGVPDVRQVPGVSRYRDVPHPRCLRPNHLGHVFQHVGPG